MAAGCGNSVGSRLFSRVVRPGAPRGRGRWSLDMEELAMTLPGGHWKETGVQHLLVHAVSYIQFLQRKIQETQRRILPHGTWQGSLPLWTPRRAVDVMGTRKNVKLGVRRRWQSRGSKVKPNVNSKEISWQTLVPYVSSSSSDNGDGGPWLVSVSMSPRSPHSPCSLPSSEAALLEMSPLLMSSPTKNLPPTLFEDMEICPWSLEDVQDPTVASSFFLDHNYLSSGKSGNMAANGCLEDKQQPSVEATLGSEVRKCIQACGPKKRARRRKPRSSTTRDDVSTADSGHSAGMVPTKKPNTLSRLKQFRKKCVNGFIMFCRLNRRLYLSANPGKASTAATKDLAELWKMMSARERRPYCMKALQFSLLHDRLVKSGSAVHPHENISPPKPVSVLLAEKTACSEELVDP